MSPTAHPLDGIMDSLAADRRRFVLAYLTDAETGQASFDELIDHVVAVETQSPSPDRDAVAAILYHQHLPKLADEGLIDYESHADTISTTPRTELAEPYLQFARRRESET